MLEYLMFKDETHLNEHLFGPQKFNFYVNHINCRLMLNYEIQVKKDCSMKTNPT